MLTLIRAIVGTSARSLVDDVIDPGAGHRAGDARRRRWVRNLWFTVLPIAVALRDQANLVIALTIFAFILTFMILDEIGRD